MNLAILLPPNALRGGHDRYARTTMDVEAETAKFLRRIQREKIVTPGPGQFVDRCHYSKTGWGIWNEAKNGRPSHCICKPAKAPLDID